MSAVADRPALAGTFTRAAGPSSVSTWNPADRTVDVTMSTGAPVARRSWAEGPYTETLEISDSAVDLSRADGMSFLDSHSPYSIGNRLGTLVAGSVRVAGGELVGTIRLSRNDRAEDIARDLDDGHPFSVSVGYRIDRFEWSDADGETPARLLATRWTPFELSIVAIPADAGSRTRSQPQEMIMPQGNPTAAPAAQDDTQAPVRFGMAQRRALIEKFGRGLDETARADLLEDHRRADEPTLRNAVLEAIVEREESRASYPHVARGEGGRADDFVRAAGEALSASGNGAVELSEPARHYRGMGFGDLARVCLERSGQGVSGESRSQLITRALHGTTDFAAVLGASFNVAVARGYAVAADELRLAASQRTAQDFKENKVVDLSSTASLLKVNEHGEFKRGSYKEAAESYRLETFGRIVGVTRQLLINDSLDLISATPEALGRKARQFEQNALAGILLGNATLSDGQPIFNAPAGNLLTATPLSLEGLSAARQHLRSTRDASGEFLGLRPKFLVVGPQLETEAERLVAQIAANNTAEVNPFAGRLQILVVPQIEDESWFVAAAPADAEALIFAYLSGYEGPSIESKAGWDVDGIEWKVRLDFGAAWIGRLGWVKGTAA